MRAAAQHGVTLDFEATVGGAVPVLGPIRDYLAPAGIEQVTGVFSATCNNLLTQMKDRLLSLKEGLDISKRAGATEPEPQMDTSGHDSALKLGLTLSEVTGTWFDPSRVAVEGIERVNLVDMAFAHEAGYCLKMVGVARRHQGSAFWAAVFPAMIPADHLLGRLEGHDGAVVVSGEGFGRVVFQGTAAGPRAVAAKVVPGIVSIARGRGCTRGTARLTVTDAGPKPSMARYARMRSLTMKEQGPPPPRRLRAGGPGPHTCLV